MNTPQTFWMPASKATVPDERRHHERQTVQESWSVDVLPLQGSFLLSGRCLDVSAGGIGICIETGDPLEVIGVDAIVALRIHTPERILTRQARICWLSAEGVKLRLGAAYLDHSRFAPATHKLDISEVRVDPACAWKIPPSLALRRGVLPFAQMDGVYHVACEDIENTATLDQVERLLKSAVQFWQVDAEGLHRAIRRVFGDNRSSTAGGSAITQDATGIGDELLYAAYLRQASDIHIDPGSQGMKVRFRVDGALESHADLPIALHSELVSRLKVMAGMDIAEKRAPQDGRFSYQVPGQNRQVDIRAATLPTKYGERMSLRLLALETNVLTLDRLGLAPEKKLAIDTFLRRSQGMMVLTGPTGSGKTTTLYASIRMLLAERNLNIMTIEDPIEYAIDGVAQCEVDSADKVSFSKALRSILRHDPDVVMIGEIRDGETADIAIKSALTGHLVLGTLHTNSAAATVTRLVDMGVEPYLVAGTLRLAIAQRLSRKLCPQCRIPRGLTEQEAIAMNSPELAGRTVFEPCGCLYCAGRGYKGRTGLYELLEMNSAWSREIAQGAGESRLLENMKQAEVPFLRDAAIDKLLDGQLSVVDALHIVSSW